MRFLAFNVCLAVVFRMRVEIIRKSSCLKNISPAMVNTKTTAEAAEFEAMSISNKKVMHLPKTEQNLLFDLNLIYSSFDLSWLATLIILSFWMWVYLTDLPNELNCTAFG